jgi:hypothetical protein
MQKFKPHSKKQETVIVSDKRLVILGCGIQFGKTISGVVWLMMQMFKHTRPDDNFLVTSPTYKILAQSTLPPFLQMCGHLGKMDKQNYCFVTSWGSTVWFRTGQNPDSPVGITNVRAVLCDEAGLYSRYFWSNIQARASFKMAPIRIVTSPYSLNWLYQDFIRPYRKGDEFIRSIADVVQATSRENPYFPDEEYEQRRRTMDARRFNMIYGGNFEKADGLVYDVFDAEQYQIEAPAEGFPPGTEYYGGIDWGYTDPFVCVIRAVTPLGNHYDFLEFYKTQCTLKGMIDAVKGMQISAGIKVKMFYADPSRPDYINEFCGAGISTIAANNDIRWGIDNHYELIKSGKYFVLDGTCKNLIDEYELYHYPEPKDLKADQSSKDELPVDQSNHAMDVVRYISAATYKGRNHKKNRVVTHSMSEDRLTKSVYVDTEVEKLKKKKKANRLNYL